jgi:hypothetical protein
MAIGKMSPTGLGGWLVLPAIGMFLTIPLILASLITDFLPILIDGGWAILTSPDSEYYHELWAPILLFEILGNVTLLLLDGLLIFLFFTKSFLFPRFFVIFLVTNVVFLTSDYFLADLIPAVAEESDPEALRSVIRAVIAAAIWIPYMLTSERVSNTFVKPENKEALAPVLTTDSHS